MATSFRYEIPKEMSPVPNLRERPFDQVDRRRNRRFRISVPVEYVLRDCRGFAITRDMSSRGIFLKTDRILKIGRRVRLLIDWPVQLNGGPPLRLVVVGRVLRSGRHGTAVSVLQHEYRVRSQA
jgi:hypothetical protein